MGPSDIGEAAGRRVPLKENDPRDTGPLLENFERNSNEAILRIAYHFHVVAEKMTSGPS